MVNKYFNQEKELAQLKEININMQMKSEILTK